MSTGKRRPATDDHRGGRINRYAADRVTREPGRPGWTTYRQQGDAWLEHDACGRTFFASVDQRAHERTCT